MTWIDSYVSKTYSSRWETVLKVSESVIREWTEFPDARTELLCVKYNIAITALHTKPLDREECEAYRLIVSSLMSGNIMIFSDWCLYYGLTENEFVEELKKNQELQFVLMFYDAVYNKLRILGKVVDNKALESYEKSRGLGLFMPYTERAQVVVGAKIAMDELERKYAKYLVGDTESDN